MLLSMNLFVVSLLALFPVPSRSLKPVTPACRAAEYSTPQSPASTIERVLFGTVQNPDGTPAAGAVVVTNLGGESVTDALGEFRLSVEVRADQRDLRLTAVGGQASGKMTSRKIALARDSQATNVATVVLTQSSGCTPDWLPTFGGQPGTDNQIFALSVFDDGNGPELYVGGNFRAAGGVESIGIAKWDGTSWLPVGTSLSGTVFALAVFDDGNGDALYAGGDLFLVSGGVTGTGVVRWDGSSWTQVAPTSSNGVFALEVFDDGGGAELYAGGRFFAATPFAANRVAKWDGSTWTPLGNGVTSSSSEVYSLAVFDDGSGPALFIGGDFLVVDGLIANSIAKWDGSAWSTLGAGTTIGGSPGEVRALRVFDNGGGAALYAAGSFTLAGATPADRVASWDGSSWSAVGSGIDNFVYALSVFDDGGGAALYAGGGFSNAGGAPAMGMAKLSGSDWTAVDGSPGGIRAFASHDDGTGLALYGAGDFRTLPATGASASRIARWSGSSWSTLGTGIGGGLASNGAPVIEALTVYDDGCGPSLFAGGDFNGAGGVETNFVARWDGFRWLPLGEGMDGPVLALRGFDDGSGPALYAGGEFSTAGEGTAFRVARWDGTSWSPVGGGLIAGGAGDGAVLAFEVFDDGAGPRLYAGGDFLSSSGVFMNNIAQWDGSNWQPIGAGVAGDVHAMKVFDDGTGEALYVGGDFTFVDGVAGFNRIAKWDGTTWTTLGAGLNNEVNAFAVFDDGLGSALFAGGAFTSAGGMSASRVAKWDGSVWSSLSGGSLSTVRALAVFDDGRGDALYAGGGFTSIGMTTVNRIAKWDGTSWSALGNGLSGLVWVLGTFDNGGGESLYVGGEFDSAIDSGDSYLARWGCPGQAQAQGTDYCNGDGGDQLGCTNCPCGNNAIPGTVGGCLNSAAASARLSFTGDASVSLPSGETTDLRFELTSAPAAAFCVLTSGASLAPANPVNPCYGLGSGVPFFQFDGLRCAVSGVRRHGGRPADLNGDVGVTNAPWGGEGAPPAGIAVAGGGFAAGQLRFFQVTYRDDPLAQCMRGLNTSQAVCVTFSP